MARARLEKEFKFRITAGELSRLKKAGKICELNRQTNHYFDVMPELPFSKHRIGIRIRNQNGKFILTVKLPTGGKRQLKGFHVQQEWESKLSRATACDVIANKIQLTSLRVRPVQAMKKAAKGLPIGELKKIGAMKNKRYRVEYSDGLSLELDHFTIRGKYFYEAECETQDPKRALKSIRSLWRRLKVPLRAEESSKLARFLSALRLEN